MGDESNYEKIIEQAKRLPTSDQRRLIDDLKVLLGGAAAPKFAAPKSSADFYGVMQGIVYDESDFEAAEWHPDL